MLHQNQNYTGFHFCKNGEIISECDPGYYCSSGSTAQRPSGIADPYNIGQNGICPIGYFCTIGTLQPEPCTNNKVITKNGATSDAECEQCPDGKICTSTVPEDCPTGFYCKSGQVDACPVGTYQPFVSKIEITDCLVCQAGFDCNALNVTRQTDFLCPAGFYCYEATSMDQSNLNLLTNFTDTRTANACEKGSYNNRLQAVDERECLNCPAGYFCLEGSLNNTQPIACEPYMNQPDPENNATNLQLASYCPEAMTDFNGTKNTKICLEGFYCSSPKSQVVCPLSYYCPEGTQDPIRCPVGSYCEPLSLNSTTNELIIGSIEPTLCPAGTVTLENSNQINFEDTCAACNPGSYGNEQRTECLPCQSGVICSIGSTTDIPSLDTANYSITAYPCPKGYYCTSGSITPIPCPAGTYNRFTFGKSETESCLPCPANYFTNQEAQLGCQYRVISFN